MLISIQMTASFADALAWLLELATQIPKTRSRETAAASHVNADGYAAKALTDECAAVASAKPGTRNDTLNKAAFNLGQFVRTRALARDLVQSALFDCAEVSGLVADDGENSVRATIASGLSAGIEQPRHVPERQSYKRSNMVGTMPINWFGGDAGSDGGTEPLILNTGAPLLTARKFIEARYSVNDLRTVHHHDDEFHVWNDRCYRSADNADIRAEVYRFLEDATRWGAKAEKTAPFDPTIRKVNDVMDALRAAANVPNTITAPAWLVNEHVPDLTHPPTEILACSNGLLHLPTLELQPHTPLFFSHNALEFAFDPSAGAAPPHWLHFLSELWQDDQEATETLQEVFGYMLTTDTSQHKVFMIVGPKRSGKGTIGRVLTSLLGQPNVCAPTLASLADRFGLEPLIGKMAAIIADARLGVRADQAAIAERLLSISGEDSVTIDRKYHRAWTGTLSTRFLLLTNQLPRVNDASGAFASRFIILTLTNSFFGKEDHGLTTRLSKELPGILNWAIEGRNRLMDRGHFVQPGSSREAFDTLEDLASPIGAFIRDRCTVELGNEVSCDTLFTAWQVWCEMQGRRPSAKSSFGRDLKAALPGIRVRQHQGTRFYEGIQLDKH